MQERDAYIALNMMDKVGPVGVRELARTLGSATAILDAAPQALMQAPGIGRGVAEAIVLQRERLDWQGEVARAGEMGVRLVAQVDDEYPAALRQIHDPPLALYVKGGLQAAASKSLAVVGTRRPTHYGRQVAERLAYGLAQAGFGVVSGLALGIDTVAHEASLKAGGRTVAVLGSGMAHLYPEENVALAERVCGSGCVLSEFPLDRTPDKTTFPMRNRIVSGLASGVIVVEAGLRSGALITATQALEQGRTVFAVPGRIDSPASQGTHVLLKDGAVLVTETADVLRELEYLFPARDRPGERVVADAAELSEDESRLLDILEDGERDVDELIRASGLQASRVSSLLLGLEMKQYVRMLPGRIVERIR